MRGVYQSGPTEAPAIVLLHSSMSSARQWRSLSANIASDFRVINIDLYGYGEAPAVEEPKTFSLTTEAERVIQILDKLEVNQYHLLGHSYGGALALKLALEQNSRLCSLMLFEPVAFHLLNDEAPGRREVQKLASDVAQSSASDAAAAFVNYWNGEGYFDALPESMQAAFSSQVEKVKLDFQALLSEPYAPQDYARIMQPTLLMTGKYSRPPAHAVAAVIGQQLPRLTAVSVSAGHMAPISHSDKVNQQIVEFLHSHLS
ncbi:alpha/beta hydrolase [Lacimicrobium sp. SS2-24]|uniref:alpha/beta fold hydrolase n=1 Tax=Lacimicrobium sp. SS2-24 TaxID=2005569 RepID=UPI000B4A74E0|nr:alpha/beta hydrolase [Lacimicrobium sp. SS2-24]